MIYATFIYTDVDECALGISGCNQICTNTIGSYVCSCYHGYQTLSDNSTCVGKQHRASLLISCRIISICSCQLPHTQTQMNVLWV